MDIATIIVNLRDLAERMGMRVPDLLDWISRESDPEREGVEPWED